MGSTNSKHDKNQSTEQTRKQLSTSQRAAPGRDHLSTSTATSSTSPDTDGKSVGTTKLLRELENNQSNWLSATLNIS